MSLGVTLRLDAFSQKYIEKCPSDKFYSYFSMKRDFLIKLAFMTFIK